MTNESDAGGAQPHFELLDGAVLAWLCRLSRCRFALPPTHVIPNFLMYSVPLFLKRQCGRTLGGRAAAGRGGGPVRAAMYG
jgi:hypothetical protein